MKNEGVSFLFGFKVIMPKPGTPFLDLGIHKKKLVPLLPVVENGQSVVCKLIPQTRRRLGLAALGFGHP